MDFLGVGPLEFVTIIILALIFIGPRDMPRMATRVAKFLRDLRSKSAGFTTEWQREINTFTDIEELKELTDEVKATQETVQSMKSEMRSIGRDIRQTVSNQPATESISPPQTPPTQAQASGPANTVEEQPADAPTSQPTVEESSTRGQSDK
jgi:Tat protein translocase TatB subunit